MMAVASGIGGEIQWGSITMRDLKSEELLAARLAVLSYLGVQDGVTLREVTAAFTELSLNIPAEWILSAVADLAQDGRVVWSGKIWLEKRSAANAIGSRK